MPVGGISSPPSQREGVTRRTASPTAGSPTASPSAKPPSRRTSDTSWANSPRAAAPRRWSSPTRPAPSHRRIGTSEPRHGPRYPHGV